MSNIDMQIVNKIKTRQLKEHVKFQQENGFSIVSEQKDAFLIVNMQGNIIFGNQCCTNMLGYQLEEIRKLNFYELVPNPDVIKEDILVDTTTQFKTLLYKRDFRQPTRMSIFAIPIYERNEIIGKYLVLSERQKSKEQNILGEGHHYNRLIDHSLYGILIIKDDIITNINMIGKRLLGVLKKEEVIGKRITSFIPVEDSGGIKKLLNSFKAEPYKGPIKHKIKKLDGTIQEVEIQALPTVHKSENTTQLIIHDLFNQKDLFQLSVLIASGIAYEMAEPIIRIKGFTDLIMNGANNTDAYYKIIQSDLRRLQEIIDDILIIDRDKS